MKQHRLELQRSKKLQDELKQLKSKPDISQRSREIINTKFADTKPIHLRIEEVRDSKQSELKKLWYYYNILLNNDLKEMQKAKVGKFDEERFNEFINNQLSWLNTKNEKIEFFQNEIARLENEASKTLYKPQINKTSESIAKSKHVDANVEDRLLKKHEDSKIKKEELVNKYKPNFTPLIAKDKPKYLKNSNSQPEQDKFLLEKYIVALTNSSQTNNSVNQKVKQNIKNISKSAKN
jgi:hypothetical protein